MPNLTFPWQTELLLRDFRPGSKDDEWTWNEEFHDLMDSEEHRETTLALIEDIKANGMKEPIVIGSDNRVWDGHHRVIAAIVLGMRTVPVRFADQEFDKPW